MTSQTPKRRSIAVDEEALTIKPSRNSSADVFAWQKAFHSSHGNRWRRKAVLVPAAILLLIIGFLAGHLTSEALVTSSMTLHSL